MASSKSNSQPKGQLLIEVLIAIGVFVIVAGSVTIFAIDAARFTTQDQTRSIARALGIEADAAMYDIWKNDIADLTNGTHGLQVTAQNIWTLTASPDTHDSLTRTITIENARRDGQGNLSLSGTPDPQTKRIEVSISHTTLGSVLYRAIHYFPAVGTTQTPNLLSWLETTLADFRNGDFNGTQRTNTNGGEVTLRPNRTTGTYISTVFNTGSDQATYDRLAWNGTYNALSDIRIQIRVGRTPNLVNAASWFGPDGTANTYFDQDDPISLPSGTQDPRRVQYRVEFTKSGSTTPVLEDIEIWYAE